METQHHKFGYRFDVQSLRGISVLAVVVFHTKESMFPFGYLGVDIFFIISGFVVTPLILNIFEIDSFNQVISNLKKFYIRRFLRLAPALGTTLILSSILIFLFANIQDHKKFALQGIYTIFLLGNLGAHKFSGDYFAPNPNPLIHTWSLSVEEQIYLVLPLLLLITYTAYKKFRFRIKSIFATLFTVSFFAFVFSGSEFLNFSSDFVFYSPLTRLWQFCLGGFLVYLPTSTKKVKSLWSMISIPTIIVFSTFLFLGAAIPLDIGSTSTTVFISILTSVVLISRALDRLPHKLIKLLIWLGDRSYSIYLIHMPILFIARYSPAVSIGDPKYHLTLIFALLSIFTLGSLNYAYVERIFRMKPLKSTRSQMLSRTSLLIFVIPLCFLLAMATLSPRSYFGLSDSPASVAISAAEWDSKCKFHNALWPCEYRTQNSRGSLLLIGDSHAAAISSAVVDAAHITSLSAEVWTFSACPFILRRTVENLSVKDGWSSCLKHNEKVFDYIMKNPPDLVLITFRTTFFVPGYLPINQQNYRSIILENVRLISNLGVKVAVIGSVPEFRVHPIVESFRSKSVDTYIRSIENPAFWSNELGILVADYLDISRIFCTNKVCINRNDLGWFYEDGGHLSIYGAKLLVPELTNYFNKLRFLS